MKTIKQEASVEITEKKSKFIGNLFYVESVDEAEKKIEEINKKYHDAKHHCFAYRILGEENLIEKASDDGEPSGTAGAPMLQLLSKNELVNVLVIVTRYFGGILLGTGGLVRAYSQATSESLLRAEVVSIEQGETLKIPVSYQNISYLQYYCRKHNISVLRTNFEKEPYVIIDITNQEKERFLQNLKEQRWNTQKIEIIKRKYIQKGIEK